MAVDPTLPSRRGHFRLESGYHTDVWLTLDALFTQPHHLAGAIDDLAARVRPYDVDAICGPFVGGAFLALLVAERLEARFFYTQLVAAPSDGMFGARYVLTPELARRIAGSRVAVVDEMVSAGSSVRATIEAVRAANASLAVVGCLTLLGTKGQEHFATIGVPLECLDAQPLAMWHPSDCPLCAAGVALET